MFKVTLQKPTWIATAAVVGLTMFVPGIARAQTELTMLTFNVPVEIPGKVLPAGTYAFKVIEPTSSYDIVQVMDKDQSHLIATILAIPDIRSEEVEKPYVMFSERPANTPEAVEGWFVPGESYGHEFVYPHDRALELARKHNRKVLSTRANIANPDELRKSKVELVDASGKTVDGPVSQAHPPTQK